jgi:AcrR family transcriptional regulator
VAAAAPAAPGSAEDPRERLLGAGLRLFAEQGYTGASTRELAEAASVNVAAISYYFGDKAGLYRAVCRRAVGEPEVDIARFAAPGLSLRQVLAGFFEGFIVPLRLGDVATLCMKLYAREMVEPTGLGDRTFVAAVQPVHDTLTDVLARHLGIADGADTDLRRLVVGLTALGVHLHSGRFITEQIAPGLYVDAVALDTWADRLTAWGLAMVADEARRHGWRFDADGAPASAGRTPLPGAVAEPLDLASPDT